MKASSYLARNVRSSKFLTECSRSTPCRMKVPGQDYHVLLISNNSKYGSEEKLERGQRLVEKERKAIIPLGVHDKIFLNHWDKITVHGTHFDACAVCAKTGIGLLHCTTHGCRQSQHSSCPRKHSDTSDFICDLCYKRNSINRASKGQ